MDEELPTIHFEGRDKKGLHLCILTDVRRFSANKDGSDSYRWEQVIFNIVIFKQNLKVI